MFLALISTQVHQEKEASLKRFHNCDYDVSRWKLSKLVKWLQPPRRALNTNSVVYGNFTSNIETIADPLQLPPPPPENRLPSRMLIVLLVSGTDCVNLYGSQILWSPSRVSAFKSDHCAYIYSMFSSQRYVVHNECLHGTTLLDGTEK